MEIKIRGIDVGAVKIINDMAKQAKLSRNEYLRLQLEQSAWLDKLSYERSRLEDALQQVMILQKLVFEEIFEIKKMLIKVGGNDEA